MRKTCSKCGKTKPEALFLPGKLRCRKCHSEYCKARLLRLKEEAIHGSPKYSDPLTLALKSWGCAIRPNPMLLHPVHSQEIQL